MKRKDFSAAVEALNSVSEIKGVKFAYAVLKNRKKIEVQVEEDKPIFEEILKPSEGFKEYEQKRIELCVLHSEKDDNGDPITNDNRYKIIDTVKFNEELTELSTEYKVSIDDRQNQMNEYNTLMEENIEINFQKIDFDTLPEDISESQLRSIEFMIDLD
jgi:vacuolar-type H+-ATPase subunit I/STV1